MSAYTPGPWSQSHRETDNRMWSTQVYTQDGETVCTLAWYPDGNGGTYREANARLIAAAPDLLNDAKKLVAEVSAVMGAPEFRALIGNTNFAVLQKRWEQMRETIDKAEAQP